MNLNITNFIDNLKLVQYDLIELSLLYIANVSK